MRAPVPGSSIFLRAFFILRSERSGRAALFYLILYCSKIHGCLDDHRPSVIGCDINAKSKHDIEESETESQGKMFQLQYI
ncbi:hypothetical protein SDJN02_06941, partial [Cucurbita argyrosperma subsp. argyrosperma]